MEDAQLRVLWITENYFPQKGGMAESCDRIVSGLRSKGCFVDVGALSGRTDMVEATRKLQGYDILVPASDPAPHALNRLWNYVERYHKERPYDCVVAFGGSVPMIAGPVYAKWLGVPLISCIRGNDFDTAVFSPNKRWILESCLNSSDVVCTVSPDKLERIRSLYPSHRVEYIPNGIDFSRWEATPNDFERAATIRREISDGRPILGLFGHLKAKKGLSFLFDSLSNSKLASQVHLLLVGELEAGALPEPAPCPLTHVPFQDRYALIPYYLACDFVLLPSFYDGLPNVLLEAGSLGKLCVASAVGGASDVLTGFGEFLFPADDVAEFREALSSALSLPEEVRAERAIALQKRIRVQFTAERELKDYTNLLQSCCRSKRKVLQRALLQ